MCTYYVLMLYIRDITYIYNITERKLVNEIFLYNVK